MNAPDKQTLLPLLIVHCFFFGWCHHIEIGTDQFEVGEAMEAHYKAQHQADIDRALGVLR